MDFVERNTNNRTYSKNLLSVNFKGEPLTLASATSCHHPASLIGNAYPSVSYFSGSRAVPVADLCLHVEKIHHVCRAIYQLHTSTGHLVIS